MRNPLSQPAAVRLLFRANTRTLQGIELAHQTAFQRNPRWPLWPWAQRQLALLDPQVRLLKPGTCQTIQKLLRASSSQTVR